MKIDPRPKCWAMNVPSGKKVRVNMPDEIYQSHGLKTGDSCDFSLVINYSDGIVETLVATDSYMGENQQGHLGKNDHIPDGSLNRSIENKQNVAVKLLTASQRAKDRGAEVVEIKVCLLNSR